jgi:hypothetical protein
MRVHSSRDVVGRWVVDERGRVLGQVVGIVHHWDGQTSALLHSGSLLSGTGRLVSLDGAVIVDDLVHLGGRARRSTSWRCSSSEACGTLPTAAREREVGFNERIGDVMWPPGETGGDEAERELAGTAQPRPGLFAALRELGITEEDAEVIVQRQRDIDTAERRS